MSDDAPIVLLTRGVGRPVRFKAPAWVNAPIGSRLAILPPEKPNPVLNPSVPVLFCAECGKGPFEDASGHASGLRYHLKRDHPRMNCRDRSLSITESRSP